jgi:DNA-binding GntR family transcriptional regulator
MREKTNSYLRIRQSTMRDHQDILKTLRKRDPEKAAKAMEEHLFNVERGYYSVVNERAGKK